MQTVFFINYRAFFTVFFFVIILMSSMSGSAKELSGISTVEVIGTGIISKDNPSRAREQAISNSLINAVEHVIYELMTSSSMVENFTRLNEILYENTDRFINDFKLLAESRINNRYRVMVQATVSIDKVRQELENAGIIYGKAALPSILLLVFEKNGKDVSPVYWWGRHFTFIEPAGEIGMTNAMEKRGFFVIDHGAQALFLDGKAKIFNHDLDKEEALNIGARFNADVVIVGKAVVHQTTNIMGANIRSFKGEVDVRAFRTQTGEKIAATTQTAVTANADEAAGRRDALFKAGQSAGEKLALQIAAAWQKEEKKSAKVEIRIEGTGNLKNFVTFRKAVHDLPGVTDLQIKQMQTDNATILVDFHGDAKKLADALMLKTFTTFGISIYEVSERFLRIGIVSEQNPIKKF